VSEVKILLIANDSDELKGLKEILKDYGQVYTANGANEGINHLKKGRFDIAFSEYYMNNGNGHDLMIYIKESAFKMPVVFLSNIESLEVLKQFLGYQIFGILEKPFTRDKIATMAESALEKVRIDQVHDKLVRVGLSASEMIQEIDKPLSMFDLGLQRLEMKYSEDKTILVMRKGMDKINSSVDKSKKRLQGDFISGRTNFKILEVILEAKEEFGDRLEKANILFQIQGNYSEVVFADKEEIRKVIVSLVNNSVEAVSGVQEKWIQIIMFSTPNSIALNVVDSGPLITDSVRKKLFSTLFSTKNVRGSGFSLSLSRRIANDHGGNLYLKNDEDHTTFSLILPRSEMN
jgi:signal transduction histidine kinase